MRYFRDSSIVQCGVHFWIVYSTDMIQRTCNIHYAFVVSRQDLLWDNNQSGVYLVLLFSWNETSRSQLITSPHILCHLH